MNEIWLLFGIGMTAFVVEKILSASGEAQKAQIVGIVAVTTGLGIAVKVISDVVALTRRFAW